MNKKRNNKGFSLVELIVVVAIMAVLVGVLAPAYLKYVENSRLQKDVSAVGEVVQAIKIAAADEDVAKEIKDGATVKFTSGNVPTATGETNLNDELEASIGKVTLSSSALGSAEVSIAVSMTADGALKMVVTPAAELGSLNVN